MTQEQLLLELFQGLISAQELTSEALLQIGQLNKKSRLDLWLPHILQFLSIMIAVGALWLTHRQNQKSVQLPYLTLLHGELNDIIISIYSLLNDPQWEAWTAEQKEPVEQNFRKQYNNFMAGNRYYVISSIPTDREQIASKIRNAGRRIMYFNLLKNRYVKIYKSLEKASSQIGKKQPLYDFFKLTEYETIYDGFKSMDDI